MPKNSVFLFLFLVLNTSLSAQTVRKYSNEFLSVGVDAAAFGQAQAVVAGTNNSNATYWNPAGLMQLENAQYSLMHASYFANIAQFDFISMAKPIDNRSAIGFSLMRFGVDDILNTTALIDGQGNINYNAISQFSAADYAFQLSYARKSMVSDLTYGVNAKVIRRVIGDFASSWGIGFDMGLQYQHKSWAFGLMIRDLTTTVNFWQVDTEIFDRVSSSLPEQEAPETTEITLPKAQLGVSKAFALGRKYSLKTELDMMIRFTKTSDIIASNFASFTPALGFELDYTQRIYLRGGVGNFQQALPSDPSSSLSFQPNIGIGLRFRSIQIDYALTDLGNQSVALYSNVFSIVIK